MRNVTQVLTVALCPLWVKSRHMQCTSACRLYPESDIKCDIMECLLYPQKQTFVATTAKASRVVPSGQFGKDHFRLSATLAMPALAHASSFSPPGAPETPTAPITSLPALIGTPPPTATTFGICFR